MPLNAQQVLQQDPGLAAAYQQHRAGAPGATPETFLAQWVNNNPGGSAAYLQRLGYTPMSQAEAVANERALNGGGNTQIIQRGDQQGNFDSQGQSSQTQTQTGSQTGTQTGTETGLQTTTGTGGSRVNDTLGLGALIQGQIPGAQAADASRQSFLSDLVETGGSGFNSQVEQATNRALSGPGMQGVGNAAKGRVAGSAVGDVARNNAGMRLQASQQLAGPTAQTNLVSAGTPFLGQDTFQTGNTATAGTTQSNTSQDSLSVADLVSNEQQSGTAGSKTNQFGVGNQPTAGGGGCYLSSVIALHGGLGFRTLRAAVKYKLSRPEHRLMCIGYSVYGPFLARLALRHSWVRRVLRPVCRAIVHEELRWAGRSRGSKLGAILHFGFHYGSTVIGWISRRKVIETRDRQLAELLKSRNLYFKETYNVRT